MTTSMRQSPLVLVVVGDPDVVEFGDRFTFESVRGGARLTGDVLSRKSASEGTSVGVLGLAPTVARDALVEHLVGCRGAVVSGESSLALDVHLEPDREIAVEMGISNVGAVLRVAPLDAGLADEGASPSPVRGGLVG